MPRRAISGEGTNESGEAARQGWNLSLSHRLIVRYRVISKFGHCMQKPLEITFDNIDPSPAIEADIRERVAKLERMYDRLVHCRVTITLEHHQQRTGNIFDVRIELVVPGEELVVSHEANHAKQHYASPDIRTSVKDAFKAAERQLKDFKERQRGDVKLHGDVLDADGLARDRIK